MTEHLLFAWDGTGRQENKFCPSVSACLGGYLSRGEDSDIVTNKYSLINFRSLHKLGSLEFRFAEATGAYERMIAFANIGLGYRAIAHQFEDSQQMLASLLAYNDMLRWFEDFGHKLLVEQLAPVIEAHGMRELNKRGTSAALSLARTERFADPVIF